MDEFGYLSVLLSVILGLALTQLQFAVVLAQTIALYTVSGIVLPDLAGEGAVPLLSGDERPMP